MGNFLVKLTENGEDFYLNWSTVVDAPTAIFDGIEDITEWTKARYGEEGLRELPQRLERLAAKGTSSLHDESAEEVVTFNRAGANETRLTVAQIIQFFGRERGGGELPLGERIGIEEDQ